MLTFFLIATCRNSNIKTDNWSFVFQFFVVVASATAIAAVYVVTFLAKYNTRRLLCQSANQKYKKKHHPYSFEQSAQLDNTLHISHTISDLLLTHPNNFEHVSLSQPEYKFYFACTWLLARHFTNIRFVVVVVLFSATVLLDVIIFALSLFHSFSEIFFCATFYAICSNLQFTK